MGIKPYGEGKSGKVGQDWCRDIAKRCETIDEVMGDNATACKTPAGTDADSHQRIPLSMAQLCNQTFVCNQLLTRCEIDRPVMSPSSQIQEAKLGEMGHYHDLPSFYEISPVLANYLPEPKMPGRERVNFLYPGSGNHIAPLEMGFQLLETTAYKGADFTYTEVYEHYVERIHVELKALERDGIIKNLQFEQPELSPDDIYPMEYKFRFEYWTKNGDAKDLSLTFVLGKITTRTTIMPGQNGGQPYPNVDSEYPPYFRQEEYDAADVIIAFDSGNNIALERDLVYARRLSAGKDKGKVFITEKTKQYINWAKENGSDMYGVFSQHYGCTDDKKSNSGLGLQPMIFKLK